MTDNVLNVLKLAFLALLYLFFLRVLWVVASEVRANRAAVNPGNAPGQPVWGQQPGQPAPYFDPTQAPYPDPANVQFIDIDGQPPVVPFAPTLGHKPKKGKRGAVGRLIIIEPRSRRGATFAVTHELTIGRSAGCSIQVVDDTFISSLHCRIFRDEAGTALVEDLGSTNGTYLNGDRIHVPKPLHRGDRVQLGSTIVEAQ